MAVRLPRLLRRLRPDLAHFLHVVPPAYRGPAVLTVQDLSFEADRGLMAARDRLFFRTLVRPSARRAARVLTGSERTRGDLVAHYGIDPAKIVLTPYGVDPAFTPDGPGGRTARRTPSSSARCTRARTRSPRSRRSRSCRTTSGS